MARPGKHAGTLVFESALIGGGFAAEKMLTQIPGWGWLTYSFVAGIVSIPLIYGSEIKAWWAKRQGRTARAQTVTVEGALTVEEVKRLRQVSAALLEVVNREYQLTQAEHLAACGMLEIAQTIFEEHDIPYPEMPYHEMRYDNSFSAWFRVIGAVIARAEDVAAARRAAQDSRSS